MDELLQAAQDLGIYLINGVLRVAYFTADHLALLIALACAAIVMGLFDRWLIELSTSTPARQGRAAPRRATYRPYARTGITIGLWLIAVLLLPTERATVLAACKNLILTYALLLLGFLWYVNTTASASPREWAGI